MLKYDNTQLDVYLRDSRTLFFAFFFHIAKRK